MASIYKKFLQTHSLKGNKWTTNKGAQNAPSAAGIGEDWLKTHKLVGGQWVPIGGAASSPDTSAPATPPASPPAFSGPITGPDESYKDSTYYGNQSNIDTGLKNLGGYLNQAGIGLGAEYGVDTGGFDVTKYDPAHPPAFNVDWQNVDVTNPRSRAALLVKSHKASERGINNGAGGTQLYSGARQNALNTEGDNYLGGQDALTKGFGQSISGLYGQWLQGQGSATTQGLTNQGEAIDRHANDPAAPPPISPELQDFFNNNSIVGGKWVAGSPNVPKPAPKPKPATATADDYKKWLATHKLVGKRWVAK